MIEPKASTLEPSAPRIENGRMVIDVPVQREPSIVRDVSFQVGFYGTLLGCAVGMATWAIAMRLYRAARTRAWNARQPQPRGVAYREKHVPTWP